MREEGDQEPRLVPGMSALAPRGATVGRCMSTPNGVYVDETSVELDALLSRCFLSGAPST